MKYSIVVPCFNEEKTLEKIIYQVLKSNINIYEVIIIDDCSNDNSKK